MIFKRTMIDDFFADDGCGFGFLSFSSSRNFCRQSDVYFIRTYINDFFLLEQSLIHDNKKRNFIKANKITLVTKNSHYLFFLNGS